MAEEQEPSMTVDQLYEYLIARMPAEEALKTLLSAQVDAYTQMKLGKDPKAPFNPLMIMVASAAEMGWDICLESDSPGDIVRGIVAGTDEYINKIFPHE